MNEQTTKTKFETIKKVRKYLTHFIIILSGALTGRFLHVYTNYKKHPAMYTAPYPGWLEQLNMDFIVYGTAILVSIIIVIVLTIIIPNYNSKTQ